MINLPQIFVSNGAALLLLSLLAVQTRKNKKTFLPNENLFICMVQILAFQCLLESFIFWVDGKGFTGARPLNILTNTLYFLLNALLPYIWTLYADYRVMGNVKRLKKISLIFFIPVAIAQAFIITSPFTNLIFSVSDDNVYHREPGFLVLYAMIYFYLIYGLLIIFVKQKKSNKYLLLPAFSFMIPIFIGTIVQFLFYGLSTVCICTAIGLIGIYISAQSESAYIDRLSSVFNRRYFDEYMTGIRDSRTENIIGIMIDMDGFKEINDTYGHLAGDESIKTIGTVLREQVGKDGFVSRYGGDEFIIITKCDSKENAYNIANTIHKEIERINSLNLNAYTLDFSYGISELMPNEKNYDDFIHRLDLSMYEMKREHKAKKLQQA